MLQMNIINDSAIIFTNRRGLCCWGRCIDNPMRTCCNPCMPERQVNIGNQDTDNGGYHNSQNNGEYNHFKNQVGNHNTQDDRKREWMSDTNQLD